MAKAGSEAADLAANAQRLRKRHQTAAADTEHRSMLAIKPAGIQPSRLSIDRRVQSTATALQIMLWEKSGDAQTAARVLTTFLCKPAQRELRSIEGWNDILHAAVSGPTLLADATIRPLILNCIKEFIAVLKKAGGQCSSDQQALDAVVAAVVSTTTNMRGRKAAYRRFLGVTSRAINRALGTRDALFDGDRRHYKVAGRKAYKNKHGSTVMGLAAEFLHEIGRPDNSGRPETKIILGSTDEGVSVCEFPFPLSHSSMLIPSHVNRQYYTIYTRLLSYQAIGRSASTF